MQVLQKESLLKRLERLQGMFKFPFAILMVPNDDLWEAVMIRLSAGNLRMMKVRNVECFRSNILKR